MLSSQFTYYIALPLVVMVAGYVPKVQVFDIISIGRLSINIFVRISKPSVRTVSDYHQRV